MCIELKIHGKSKHCIIYLQKVVQYHFKLKLLSYFVSLAKINLSQWPSHSYIFQSNEGTVDKG